MTLPDEAGRTRAEADNTVTNLPEAASELLEQARDSRAGRAARTLVPGAHTPMKQTLLALTAGETLAEHSSPTAAALQVLIGRVRVVGGEEELYLDVGDHAPIPPVRHHVDAIDDAVMLLTVTQ